MGRPHVFSGPSLLGVETELPTMEGLSQPSLLE